ncbi:MAG: cyclic nucleotide-binding domain-containing protein [Limisphaerales bacterium]
MKKVLFIFGELDDLDIDWMTATGRKERIPAGTALIQEGKSVGALYIVLDGSLSVLVGQANGREIARLGPGDIVGEISFVDARPPSATVKARDNSVVLAVPREKLAGKLQKDTAFAARFYRALAVFLSYRLRNTTLQLGYGADQILPVQMEEKDELDANLLDNVYLAGARFDRMVKQLMVR